MSSHMKHVLRKIDRSMHACITKDVHARAALCHAGIYWGSKQTGVRHMTPGWYILWNLISTRGLLKGGVYRFGGSRILAFLSHGLRILNWKSADRRIDKYCRIADSGRFTSRIAEFCTKKKGSADCSRNSGWWIHRPYDAECGLI